MNITIIILLLATFLGVNYCQEIIPLYQTHFEIESFDLISNSTQKISSTVNLLENKLTTSHKICSQIHPHLQFDYSYYKCMLPLIQSLRWSHVNQMSQFLDLDKSQHAQESEMYALSYAYEPTRYYPEGSKNRVCVFGNPYQTTLLSIISSSIVGEIFLFVLSTQFDIEETLQFFALERDIKIISYLDAFNKELLPELRYSCDIMHFEDNFPLIYESIYDLILFYSKAAIISHKSRIILHEIIVQQEYSLNAFDGLVHWKLTNTWLKSSYFNMIQDNNGFLRQHYVFHPDYLGLSNIKIGEINSRLWYKEDEKQNKPLSFTKDRVIIFLTSTNRPLIDNLFGYKEALKAIGYKYVQILTDLTLASYEILEIKAKQLQSIPIQIMLGSEVSIFSTYYIYFNSEQIWNSIIFATGLQRTKYILQHSLVIWSFFSYQTPIFDEINYTNVSIVPFHYATRDFSRLNINPLRVPLSHEPIKVLFFGSCTHRRLEKLQELSQYFKIYSSELVFHYLCGSIVTQQLNYERDYLIQSIDIVINLSGEENSVLEVHRLNYLLSMGKVIVSEPGINLEMIECYSSVVYFTSEIQDMVRYIIEDIARNRSNLQENKRKSIELFHQINTNYSLLEQTLEKSLNKLIEIRNF